MDEVFTLIYDMFGYVISWLKMIPVTDNVSLFDFSLGMIIITIISVAFVNVVKIGGVGSVVNYQNERERISRRDENRAYRESVYQKHREDNKNR